MSKRICIIGCGAIGSLYAAHLARVAEVHAFVRRPEHARALNEHGLRVSGTHKFTAKLHAAAESGRNSAMRYWYRVLQSHADGERAGARRGQISERRRSLSAQNGLGCEEIIAELIRRAAMIRGTTFMSGTRHSDTHVQYELDTETWMGPFEPSGTPFLDGEKGRRLDRRVRPESRRARRCATRRSGPKLIFNAVGEFGLGAHRTSALPRNLRRKKNSTTSATCCTR